MAKLEERLFFAALSGQLGPAFVSLLGAICGLTTAR